MDREEWFEKRTFHHREFADIGRLVELKRTRTLIAEDRPERLASLLRWFVAEG